MTNKPPSPLLNKELIQRTLQSYHNITNENAFDLKAFDFKLISEIGENYNSEIYDINIKYILNGNTENKSFIAKILLPDLVGQSLNEELMLFKILPAMEKCLKVKSKLYAKCVISERKEQHEFYILENLNSLGYFCADRTKGLDLKHAEVLMLKIAKFHAASMVLNKKFPELKESLGKCGFENGVCDDITKEITFGGFEYVANMIQNWPGFENLSQKIRNLIPKFNEKAKETANLKNSKFQVINHSDLWVNNFLYKYDDSSRPTDVIFVDFESCFWGSCGFDINYFLHSSLELNVLKEQRHYLIQIYSDALLQNLKAENYPKEDLSSPEDILMEIRHCEFLGLHICLCDFPMFALEKSKSQILVSDTFSQPEKMKELRDLIYSSPRVKDTLAYSLKYFEEINVL